MAPPKETSPGRRGTFASGSPFPLEPNEPARFSFRSAIRSTVFIRREFAERLSRGCVATIRRSGPSFVRSRGLKDVGAEVASCQLQVRLATTRPVRLAWHHRMRR